MSICRNVLLLGCLLCTFAGCGDNKTTTNRSNNSSTDGALKRIVFINNQNSPFWDACRAGMLEAQKELKLEAAGLTTIMEVNDGSPEGQIDKLRQFGTQQDIAGIAISPIVADNPSIAQELRKLRGKGLPVICVDNDLGERYRKDDTRQFYIGTDNVKGGKQLGLCAKALRPEGGEYVQFVGRTGAQNARERMDGFKETVGDKFIEKARMADGGPPNSRNTVRDALTNYPDLKILVGIWSYNAPAIVDVVKERNRPDLTVVTFDAEKLAVEAMDEGHIDAMVVQNPFDMGYQMVKLLKALHENDEATVKEMFPKHGEPGGDIYETGLKVVLPSAESPVKQVEFDKGTEVLTLDEFKEWLAKYNLESS
jgi:ribose transport system substrate-binding protein